MHLAQLSSSFGCMRLHLPRNHAGAVLLHDLYEGVSSSLSLSDVVSISSSVAIAWRAFLRLNVQSSGLVRHVFRLLAKAKADRRAVPWVLLENVRPRSFMPIRAASRDVRCCGALPLSMCACKLSGYSMPASRHFMWCVTRWTALTYNRHSLTLDCSKH